MLVALEMVIGGLAVAYFSDVRGRVWLSRVSLGLLAAGVLVLLVAFMWDALLLLLGAAPSGALAASASPVPDRFPWEVYGAGQALTLTGMAWLICSQRRSPPARLPLP
jgi:hypothetical protein